MGQLAFHGQLFAFFYIFFDDFGGFAPGGYGVPLGVGYFFTFVVMVIFVGGNNQACKFFAGLQDFDFRVGARVAY